MISVKVPTRWLMELQGRGQTASRARCETEDDDFQPNIGSNRHGTNPSSGGGIAPARKVAQAAHRRCILHCMQVLASSAACE